MKVSLSIIMHICIILFLFTASLLASDEIEPKFGTKPEHLSANITSARDFNFEGWNIAGLGFLDRSELTFEVGNPINAASESDTMNFQTIYAGYSRPTIKWGVFSVGVGDFLNMVNSNNKHSIYPYIGYSKEFLNLFSLGGAYALETELMNGNQNLLNGITQFGLMINIYNYIHLGASIENSGYYDKIDSARVGASIIYPASSRNYAFIGADLNSSFKEIKLFDSATSELENINVGGGIKLGFFSIKGWLSKDVRYKGSPYRGFIELSLSKSISNDRLHSITLGGRLYENENEYFLTSGVTYSTGESIAGKKNMNMAEKLMSEYSLKDAIKYYKRSKHLLISEDNKNTATQNEQSAIKMLNDNNSFYSNGNNYYESQEYDKAILEFKKIPSWSEYFVDAQRKLRISKNEYTSQLYDTITIKIKDKNTKEAKQYLDNLYAVDPEYKTIDRYVALENKIKEIEMTERKMKLQSLYQQAIAKYNEQQFDEAGKVFKEIIAIDPFYMDVKQKTDTCERLTKAIVLYKQLEYSESAEICKQVSTQYPDEPIAKALYNKALGEIEYNNKRFQEAIRLWSITLSIEKNSYSFKDTYLENKLDIAEKRFAIEKATQAIDKRKYDEAILILKPLEDYEPAKNLIQQARKGQEVLKLYEQAIFNFESKQYSEAEKKLLDCLSIDPDFNDAKQKLEILYKDLLSEVRSVFLGILMDQEQKILEEIKAKLDMIINAQYADRKDIASAFLYSGTIYIILPPKDKAKAKDLFIKALNANLKCELTNDINYPDVSEVFNDAKKLFIEVPPPPIIDEDQKKYDNTGKDNQKQPPEKQEAEFPPAMGTVNVKSVPVGADIYINGNKRDELTNAILSLPIDAYILVLKKLDYRDSDPQTIHLHRGENPLEPIQLISQYGVLDISSKPSNVPIVINDANGKIVPIDIYNDDITQKRTPSKVKLRPSKYTIILNLDTPSEKVKIANNEAMIVNSEPSGIPFVIKDANGKKIEENRTSARIDILPSEYTVTLEADSYKYSNKVNLTDQSLISISNIFPIIKGPFISKFPVISHKKMVFFSLFVPGLGQIYGKHYRSGVSFILGEAGSMTVPLVLSWIYNNSVKDFNNSVDKYNNAFYLDEIESARKEVNDKYDDKNKKHFLRNCSFAIPIVCWVANIIHVCKIKPDYISSSQTQVDVSNLQIDPYVTTQGVMALVKYRF